VRTRSGALGRCGNAAPVNGYQDRCGDGPRLPLLVLSPYSQQNLVDHSIIDQTSIPRFVGDNWALPRIGGGSLDAIAGSIDGMFDFKHSHRDTLILDPKASSTGHFPTVRAGAGHIPPPCLSSASPDTAD
jgi:phospholipase C